MLSDSTPDPLVEELAESFVARFRKGERPSVSEYTRQYPELARQIQEIFPALVVMELVQQDIQQAVSPTSSVPSSPLLSSLGDYRIVREIGRGGMGIVYEAEQVSLGRRVALKVLSGTMLGDPKHRKRFEREAKAAARLHHTNIVPVFGVGEQSGVCYYVMQYIHGQGLDDVLKELKQLRQESLAQKKQSLQQQTAEMPVYADRPVALASLAASLHSGQFEQTRLSPESDSDVDLSESWNASSCSPGPSLESTAVGNLSDTAPARSTVHLPGQNEQTAKAHGRLAYWQSIARIGVQVASALQNAHEQGIIHRDIKPANLLLDMRGSVWVTDFGLAKATDQQDLTHSGDVLGTLRYMAPEQFDGAADPRSDLYSLGLTLYELLTLRPAFDQSERQKLIKQVTTGTPPRLRSMDPDIPRDLETVIQKAIDRDPNHRYQTAAELADDLSRFLGDEPIKARRISLVAHFRRWCRKNPVVAALSSTIALLITTAAVTASMAAVRFEKLATDNGKLAGDLQTALGSAQSNLTLANSEKKRAEEALALVTAEQQRAEGNLDLALKAMDAVYLEAIGTEKLLGEPTLRLDGQGIEVKNKAPLTEMEKGLLKRGLAFYEQFAQQNAASPKAAQQTAQAYYRVGMIYAGLQEAAAGQRSFKMAVDKYESLLRENPNNKEYSLQLANAYLQLGIHTPGIQEARNDIKKSIDSYTGVIQRGDVSADIYHQRAVARELLNDDAGALEDLRTALQLDPKNPQRHAFLANRLSGVQDYKLRNYVQSAEHLHKAIDLSPGDVGLYTQEAFLHVAHLNDLNKALLLVEKALKLSPDNPEAIYIRARVHEKQGNTHAAIEDMNRVFSLGAASARDLTKRGYMYHLSKQYDKALDDYTRALSMQPHNIYALEGAGEVYLNTGRHEEAIRVYSTAIEIAPRRHWSYMFRARAYFRANRPMEALQDIESAFAIYPQSGNIVDWISASQVAACPNQEFKDGMLQFATEAIERNPAVRPARMQLALALGRVDIAREDLNVISKDGNAGFLDHYQVALLSLTGSRNLDVYKSSCQNMLSRFGESPDVDAIAFTGWTCALVPGALPDYAPVLTITQRAIEKSPKDADLLRSLGALQLRAGLHQVAVETLSPLCEPQGELASDKSSNSYPLFFLAMAQYQSGQRETANETLTRAVTLAHKELSNHETLAWNRKLTLELLRDEAVALIGPVDVPPPLGPRIPPAPEPATTLPEPNPGN